jgi:ligand-binding sensor domain-containing protein
MRLLLSFAFFQVIIFFAAFTSSVQSQYFKHFQADDGLAHNAASYIIQDKKGFIWVCTGGGLNRFDRRLMKKPILKN